MNYYRTIRTRKELQTDTRGTRILATLSTAPKRLTLPYDHSLTTEQNHETAARALYAREYGWPGQPVPKPAGYSDTTGNGWLWHFAAVKGQP